MLLFIFMVLDLFAVQKNEKQIAESVLTNLCIGYIAEWLSR